MYFVLWRTNNYELLFSFSSLLLLLLLLLVLPLGLNSLICATQSERARALAFALTTTDFLPPSAAANYARIRMCVPVCVCVCIELYEVRYTFRFESIRIRALTCTSMINDCRTHRSHLTSIIAPRLSFDGFMGASTEAFRQSMSCRAVWLVVYVLLLILKPEVVARPS